MYLPPSLVNGRDLLSDSPLVTLKANGLGLSKAMRNERERENE